MGLYIGQEEVIVTKFLEVDLLDKVSTDSKSLRHYLNIGMPEARAIGKRCYIRTVREWIAWYWQSTKSIG